MLRAYSRRLDGKLHYFQNPDYSAIGKHFRAAEFDTDCQPLVASREMRHNRGAIELF